MASAERLRNTMSAFMIMSTLKKVAWDAGQASHKYVLKIIFIFDAPYLDVLNIHMLYIGIVMMEVAKICVQVMACILIFS